MTGIKAALSRLERDRALYANLLEILRRGSAEVLYAGADGILAHDVDSGSHMMSAAGRETAGRLLELVPEGCDLFTGHELFYLEAARERLGLRETQVCHSALWRGPGPMPAPPCAGELRLLAEKDAPYVDAHYSHSFGGLSYIEGAIRRGMVGAWVDGVLAGFVGFHAEGAIGMLEVLPQYRRGGLAAALQAAAVNLALSRGQYAFGQVFDDNEASLALQRRLGMEISSEKLFWIF